MLKISVGSGKMKGLNSLNTNTLTNEFCQKSSKKDNLICSMCYSVQQLKTYRKNCQPSWENNSKLLSERIIDEFYLPQITDEIFRFNSHGELINDNHMINIINLVNKNYRTTFTLWTKRIGIVNKVLKEYKKPKNLILIYSSPILNSQCILPKNFDKVFTGFESDNENINCFGDCLDCRKCYDVNDTTTHINEKIKPYSRKVNK